MSRNRELASVDGVEETHASYCLGLGGLQAVVDELGLKPVSRMILFGAGLEVVLQLCGGGATMTIVAAGLGEEVSGVGEAILANSWCKRHNDVGVLQALVDYTASESSPANLEIPRGIEKVVTL